MEGEKGLTLTMGADRVWLSSEEKILQMTTQQSYKHWKGNYHCQSKPNN